MSRNRQFAWLGLALTALAILVVAAFDNGGPATDEERIQTLSESYACPECDGQTVAESNAAVAATIRDFIRVQVNDGATEDEIRDRLLQAYGTDVLLTPPAEGFSALIWILPVMVIVLGMAGVVTVVRRTGAADREVTGADRELVEQARRTEEKIEGGVDHEEAGDVV